MSLLKKIPRLGLTKSQLYRLGKLTLEKLQSSGNVKSVGLSKSLDFGLSQSED